MARELRRRLGFDVLAGLKFRQPGVGGDLDLVAAAEGRLAYLELKSSPPRHLSEPEVAAFFDRLQALRPDLALFVMDTALRLSEKGSGRGSARALALGLSRSRRGSGPGGCCTVRNKFLKRNFAAMDPLEWRGGRHGR